MHIEQHYDFRKRLAVLHPPRLASDAAPLKDNETLVDASWTIVPASDDPVLMHGVRDLKDYFEKSMGVQVKIGSGSDKNTITVGVAPEKNNLTSRITAGPGFIRITGATAREAAQGCYRLEDLMNPRGLPAVEHGERTFTRLFSPRMTHSGWELEQFPNEYLDHIAHAGMDAILIFIREPPNMTRNGPIDLPEVVRNAAEYGIDVYVYPHVHTQAAECHPADPGAREFYDNLYGSIVKYAPGIRGMVFVGESVAFPSRDPGMGGYWWKHQPGAKHLNGFYPCTDWPEWLCLVRDVTRQYNPDLDLLFWTYNWFWAPEKERLALLENIPTDITLHVTYEMGDTPIEKCGIPTWVSDYSITTSGPGTVFASEAGVAAKRGIRLSSMTNTGGMTWDCGVIPYVPAPYKWEDRFRTLRESRKKWGLVSLMDSHHYGFTPSFISDLAKACFTEEFDMEKDFGKALAEAAERDFGRENVPYILDAWKDWSDAIYWHSAHGCDQYGPLRNGPVYPFTLPGVPLPDPIRPNYEYNNGIRHGSGWMYVQKTYSYPPEHLAGSIEMTEREWKLLASGNMKMRAALNFVRPEKYDAAKRMLGIGEFLYHTVRTLCNVKKYYRNGLEAKKDGADRAALVAEMRAILDDEELNVRETIPFVEEDSRLGWEPTMLYTTDRENLEWKLDQLKDARAELEKFAAGESTPDKETK